MAITSDPEDKTPRTTSIVKTPRSLMFATDFATTAPAGVFSKHPATSVRSLSIRDSMVEPPVDVIFPIPIQDYQAADLVRDQFLQGGVSQHLSNIPAFSEFERQVRLGTCFLQFIVLHFLHAESGTPSPETSYRILTALLQEFCMQFLQRSNNVHTATRDLPHPLRQLVISTFYKSLTCLRQLSSYSPGPDSPRNSSSSIDVLSAPQPALFLASQSGQASLFAVFGGQGGDTYFDEMIDIVNTYPDFVNPFLAKMADVLRKQADDQSALEFHSQGLLIQRWIHVPESRPTIDYLVSAPVSLPLIGLTQLLNYFVLMKILDISPKELKTYFKGATGHSQGLVSAVAIASSDTEEEFFENARRALLLLFWIGCRSQQVYPLTTLNPTILKGSLDSGDGAPTPMLSVSNIGYDIALKLANEHNKLLPDDRKVSISLINGARTFVCAGHPQSLYGLNVALSKMKAKPGQDDSRVPYNKRRIKLTTKFLPVTVPFHTDLLKDAVDLVADDIERFDLNFASDKVSIPVYSNSGSDMRIRGNIALSLVEQVCCKPIYWEKSSLASGASHILDFGPGGSSGIGALTQRNADGTGVQIVLAGSLESSHDALLCKTQLLDSTHSAVRFSVDWKNEFRPKLIQTKFDGKIHLDTRFSRVLGKPPLMVAGMTPTTVSPELVAATIKAGYHIELAGGGHYDEASLRRSVNEIIQQVPAGESITLNILYLNQAQWSFQFPLALRMKKEGIPIEGICIAAGVPSLEMAVGIVESMKDAGLKHVALKPGSIDAIRQVIQIAKSCPDFPLILQWTGGRAGGHHGFEDIHLPLLETYSSIRQQSNILLVVGSGFGDADGSLPYLTGDWSVPFGYPSMPVDGLLMGSRLLVAREARTSDGAKDCIVAASGIVDEEKWVNSYDKITGGVITVKSELGEPIHKIATRGVMLWKEFDDTIFSLKPDEKAAVLVKKRDYIIERLNKDFQKPWFGRRQNGSVADIQDMTYREVVDRMIELMFIRINARGWIHSSYRKIVGDFLVRIEERFSTSSGPSSVLSDDDLLHPDSFISSFFDKFPESVSQLLTSDDILYFFTICSRRNQKPVPFIPVLDERFETWFKKDSLWQAEDLDAVLDQDPQRVCILQGPVAVKHSTAANETVKSILDSITHKHVASVLEKDYGGDLASVPASEYVGGVDVCYSGHVLRLVSVSKDVRSTTFYLSDVERDLPQASEWLEFLSGPSFNWVRALLTSQNIFQGKRITLNPISRVFRPRAGQRVRIDCDDNDSPISISIFHHDAVAVRATFSDALIQVSFFENGNFSSSELVLQFKYNPRQGYAPIHEIMEGRNDRIKEFYYRLWVGDLSIPNYEKDSVFDAPEHVITRNEITAFCRVVGNQAEAHVDRGQVRLSAPMDFAMVAGWKSIICALFPKFIDADLLKLVHLSNSFRMLDPSDRALQDGDVVSASSQIESVVNTASGKILQVKGIVSRNSKPMIQIVSKFMYRGTFSDFDTTFDKTTHDPMSVELKAQKDIAVLESRSWFVKDPEGPTLLPGSTLIFRLESYYEFAGQSVYNKVVTTGKVSMQISTKEFVDVGLIRFKHAGSCYGNPVLDYLNRNGSKIERTIMFDNGGYSMLPKGAAFSSAFTSPALNIEYSRISGDVNPIHTSPYVAMLADLPGTITHGMWTSAATKKFVEIFAAGNNPEAVRAYNVNFVDMVLPGEKLETKLTHIGMEDGKKLVKVQSLKQDGTVVLEGTAEVDQPTTAFVFTGQGSQSTGMGMDLYDSSPIARAIWDRADKHFMDTYGVSIIDIVKNNPNERTVNFGNRLGTAIRKNYQALTIDVLLPGGSTISKPLFPEITDDSESFTFTSPSGLLSATQFTQPALTLMEKAAFEDMKSKGLVPSLCAFAGHSLGEYSALASIADVLTVETLVDVVFYRGLSMQSAVPRDAIGRSNYGMVAVSPIRVRDPLFDEKALKALVGFIHKESKGLLEIVNYNIEKEQYVVAGDLVCLETLKEVLNLFRMRKISWKYLAGLAPAELSQMVSKILADVQSLAEPGTTFVALNRGLATTPLAGIDVPFHSSFLRGGVPAFREYLSSRIKESWIDVHLLINRYIPNVIAEPFQLSRDYIDRVFAITDSERLHHILVNWSDELFASAAQQQKLGHTLLIELLAYQFASPVMWIKTQDVLLKKFGVMRLIELGPRSVLRDMTMKTLQKKEFADSDVANCYRRENLCYARDRDLIYYVDTQPDDEDDAPGSVSTPMAPSAVVAAPVSVAAAPTGVSVDHIADAPIPALDVLRSIIAHKLKRKVTEVPLTQSIKDIVGGKSTMQNEILGDLAKEFGSDLVPDKSEELPIQDLSNLLSPLHSGNLGSYTSTMVNKLVSSKFPGGFGLSHAKKLLADSFGLGALRSDALLLHAATMEPTNRFGSEDDVVAWMSTAVSSYCALAGIQLAVSSSAARQDSQVAVVSSAELISMQMRIDNQIRDQLEGYAKFLGIDLREGFNNLEKEQAALRQAIAEIDFWVAEHGHEYADGIKPVFDPLKVRTYDSYWNWVHQDALLLFYDIIYGRLTHVDRAIITKCIHMMNRSNPRLLQHLRYKIMKDTDVTLGPTYKLAKELGTVLIDNIESVADAAPVYRDVAVPTGPRTTISESGEIQYTEVPRPGVSKFEDFVREMKQGSDLTAQGSANNRSPFIFLKSRDSDDPNVWNFDDAKTQTYFNALESMVKDGITFRGKHVLVTGCGEGSIGGEIVKALLAGGAQVIATTSRLVKPVHDYFRQLYERHGSNGSRLIVFQFNQGSKQDVDALINYIYNPDPKKGLGVDLDYVIPFAAISENGRSLFSIDSRSELAHRIMLTNVYRLLGNVASKKRDLRQHTRPAQVLLPLSPNHGIFGNDGLYSESKLGLESLMSRWESEDWGDYLTIVGTVIGWTRGTRLMTENNLIAEGIEAKGVRTFSTSEMAYCIVGLMHFSVARLSQEAPLVADLSGGMKLVHNLKALSTELRSFLTESSSIRRAISREDEAQSKVMVGPAFEQTKTHTVSPRANLKFQLPEIPTDTQLKSLEYLQGMLDLDRVVVVTGYGEVGPYGNARTRWEMEAFGEFSLEGCIELSWIMGYIKYISNRRNKDGSLFSGWVDAVTESPVHDYEVKKQYEERILKHTGIRMIEAELFQGYNPEKKQMLQEIVIDRDMPAFECSKEEADNFKRQHGDLVDIVPGASPAQLTARLKKGATLYIPKALRFDRLVAGQIPTGWDAQRYGVPKDIVDQVDPVTLYVLVSTVDALVSSGITDPYEFYKYVHISEVGNTAGGGVGGMVALRAMYKNRFLDKPVQKDILQESFINTMPAWVNLLLLSSAGPIKSPVGACATAVQSIEIGIDTLLSGKAKVVICGGYDDFTEEGSQEFANMGATSNSVNELAHGREPREMCRPATSSRGGFMESHGAGIHILMTASVAIEMGVPIYGIIAHTSTAMDKAGRSIPAPGQGILSTARESHDCRPSPLLDIEYRARRLKKNREMIKASAESDLEEMYMEAKRIPSSERQQFIQERSEFIQKETERQHKHALATWSHDFAKGDASIAPLRAALAVYGLNIDDINVASFHGTGTKANDINESEVVDKQLKHLGRSEGNVIPSIFQKYLTGHPKGAAAAWMLNGMLNVLNTGIVPGNRNADNIDSAMGRLEFVIYPSRSIQTDGLKAGLLKSFGFGQVGGECLVVHSKYLFASLPQSQFESYKAKRTVRQQNMFRYLHDSLVGTSSYVQVKASPPFTPQQESAVYLDPLARAEFDRAKQTFTFSGYEGRRAAAKPKLSLENLFQDLVQTTPDLRSINPGIGCDHEWIADFPFSPEFVERNFTPVEIAYCQSTPDPISSFAGRWCAKEAVLKSISDFATKNQQLWTRGAAAPLNDIEILPSKSGAPQVVLHGEAKDKAASVGVQSIKVTISHSSTSAEAGAFSF